MTTGGLLAPAPLSAAHDLAPFDCGVPVLNDWLKLRARKNEAAGASRTYAVCDGPVAVGYYCLATGAVARDEAAGAIRRNMPEQIPVIVLGRLAIDHRYQRQGLGQALLRDAVLRVLQAADIAGIKAILVHAIAAEAKRFYLAHGFLESPVQPLTLYLPLDTVRQAIIE